MQELKAVQRIKAEALSKQILKFISNLWYTALGITVIAIFIKLMVIAWQWIL